MYKKKMYTVTFDYKPTQKEAMQAMAAELDKVQSTAKQRGMDFQAAAVEYIDAKRNVLSPTTIRGYHSAMNIPEADIMRMGGWETDYVMKNVYRHSMMEKEEKAKREAAEKLRNALFS